MYRCNLPLPGYIPLLTPVTPGYIPLLTPDTPRVYHCSQPCTPRVYHCSQPCTPGYTHQCTPVTPGYTTSVHLSHPGIPPHLRNCSGFHSSHQDSTIINNVRLPGYSPMDLPTLTLTLTSSPLFPLFFASTIGWPKGDHCAQRCLT